jgi:hypothetical protein
MQSPHAKENEMKNYKKLVAGLIFGWFVFAVAASARHLFLNPANRVGIAVAVAAVAPIVIFSLWLAASESFRRFTLSLNPRLLTLLQSWRVLGVLFVILEARGVLPAIFALPAGYGDITIGITASLVALWLAVPGHRLGFVAWQVLGIADLVTAVGLGTTAQLLSPGSVPMVAVTVLPLSLIPTFLVPLFLIIHLICIAQARSWQAASGETPQAAALSRS